MRRILHAVVLAMLVMSMSGAQALAGRGDCKGDQQRKRDGSGPNCEFVDENGDGICDKSGECVPKGRDDDGDGIPNGQDPDYQPKRDGSGRR
jgi:hypothetical protein